MLAAEKRYEKSGMIGARIRTLRERDGLTQSDLGRRMGESRQVVNKIERGAVRITMETLSEVARALQRPATDLIQDDDGNVLLKDEYGRFAVATPRHPVYPLLHECTEVGEVLTQKLRLLEAVLQTNGKLH
jgi:transcriptional regulator with XRE-family HTH domain